MRNIRRRALLASAMAMAPLMFTAVAAHAEVDSPPLTVPGLNGNCITSKGGAVAVLGPGGVLVVNTGYIAVQGIDCWL
jgi:hypothetical protein